MRGNPDSDSYRESEVTAPFRIRVVFDDRGEPFDAIGAYTVRLALALDALPGTEASSGSRAATRCVDRADVTLLQYNPFSYGRAGLAPGVPLWLLSRRLTRASKLVVVMVHEPYVAPWSVRTLLMAALQRLQLAAIKAVAHLVLTPTADAARRTQGLGRRPQVVPVGSNLPDRRSDRTAVRTKLGVATSEPVLAVLARSTASHQIEHLLAAARRVATLGRCHLLLLGAEMAELQGLPEAVIVHRPGALADYDLACQLAGADIFLAPYLDGVSTRRTSLAAALQHGLPVVGTTVGRSDEVLLSDAGLVVVPAEQVDEFAEAARRLVADPNERAKRSQAARELYDHRFAWPVIALGVQEAVQGLL